MFSNWRISSFSGALLAAYFIPTWTLVAFQIIVSPIHGLYEQPSISVALFVSDHLHLSGVATVRLAWLLALARVMKTRKIAKNATTVSRPRANNHAKRIVVVAARCRWSLMNKPTEIFGRS